MANAMVTKYQIKVFELQNQADALATAMANNPDNENLPVQLATVKIKLDAAKMVFGKPKPRTRDATINSGRISRTKHMNRCGISRKRIKIYADRR